MADLLRCEKCRDEVATLIKGPPISEVAHDWPEGLCPTCYEVVTGTVPPRRVSKAKPEEPPRQKRKYTRRKPLASKPVVEAIGSGILPPRKGPERETIPTSIGKIERIRLSYIDQRKKTEQMLADLDLKIQTANEILEAVR